MKILYISQYFPPEMGAPAARASELANHWAEAGHEVTVLTGFPNHPTGILHAEYRGRLRRLVMHEKHNQVSVVRTWLWPLPNRKSYERMLNYASFCISAAITGLFLKTPDVVIATSPQLLVGLSGWWISRWKQIPLVFEVRDLWPESLSAVGLDDRSILHAGLGKIAGFLYRQADKIVVVTPAFRGHLTTHWAVPDEKIAVVLNGVETELFSPRSANPALLRELNAEGKFVVCYIGTMGWAHGLDTLVEAAAELQSTHPEVVFLLVGEGADKERILVLAQARGVKNLRVVGQQPRVKIPDYINASDLCLVLLKKTELFKTVIPTKMLEFMACGRPVILAVDGQARSILEEAVAGVFVEPQNSQDLAGAVRMFLANPQLRISMGKAGRDFAVKNFSRKETATSYLRVLGAVIAE